MDRRAAEEGLQPTAESSPRPTPESPARLRARRRARAAVLLVVVGCASSLVTVLAQHAGDVRTMTAAAVVSLGGVALMFALIAPALWRSLRAASARLDLPVRVTGGGLIFLGIFLVVVFAALNTGNNLLFLIFSVLASTLFVSWMAARASLRDLVVSARFPDHIFAGEPAPVIVTLRNEKRLLPSFSVLIEARGPVELPPGETPRRRKRLRFGKRPLAYFVYVPHRAAAEQRIEQLFERRGHVLITGFELSTGFPFGFFRRRRRLRARDVDLIVYPKPEPASDELHLLPMNAGRLASFRRGAGHDLLALRDYQPQDDLRHIDWKATARSSRLTVREFAAEDERRVTVAFDTGLAGDGKNAAARFERGVSLAASFVAHLVGESAEVRLILGDEAGRYGSTREHLYDCLRRLALVEPRPVTAESAPDETDAPPHAPAGADEGYTILLTTAAPGSIPSSVWRTSHVVYL